MEHEQRNAIELESQAHAVGRFLQLFSLVRFACLDNDVICVNAESEVIGFNSRSQRYTHPPLPPNPCIF